MRFSRSTHLQMFLSLKSLTSIWGWLTYSGGTDRSGVNSVIIFYNFFTISNDLTQMVNFLHGSQTVILTDLLFWIYFVFLMLLFVLQWLSFHWEILIILLSQIPLTFHHIHNGMPCFIALLTILMLVGMVFVII